MSKRVLILNTGGTLASVAKEHGLTPGLTTVRPPAREIGITAAARIFQLLQEDPPAFDTLRKGQRPMSCELIIRASS